MGQLETAGRAAAGRRDFPKANKEGRESSTLIPTRHRGINPLLCNFARGKLYLPLNVP